MLSCESRRLVIYCDQSGFSYDKFVYAFFCVCVCVCVCVIGNIPKETMTRLERTRTINVFTSLTVSMYCLGSWPEWVHENDILLLPGRGSYQI